MTQGSSLCATGVASTQLVFVVPSSRFLVNRFGRNPTGSSVRYPPCAAVGFLVILLDDLASGDGKDPWLDQPPISARLGQFQNSRVFRPSFIHGTQFLPVLKTHQKHPQSERVLFNHGPDRNFPRSSLSFFVEHSVGLARSLHGNFAHALVSVVTSIPFDLRVSLSSDAILVVLESIMLNIESGHNATIMGFDAARSREPIIFIAFSTNLLPRRTVCGGFSYKTKLNDSHKCTSAFPASWSVSRCLTTLLLVDSSFFSGPVSVPSNILNVFFLSPVQVNSN